MSRESNLLIIKFKRELKFEVTDKINIICLENDGKCPWIDARIKSKMNKLQK